MTHTYDAYRREDGTYCLPNGIYVGLPEEIYHADTALGSTSVKALATDPVGWQYDRLRPRKGITPEYLTFGRAWHCRILEGKAEFDKRYAKPPTPADVPGCLSTSDDIKEFLKMNGQKLTGRKEDLIARAKELDDCPPIYDEVLAQWRRDNPKHEELSERQVLEIEDSVTIMMRDPTLASVMVAGSLIDGAAELSVFVTDERGVRRKGRYDYAIPPAGSRIKALITDLKSFTSYKVGTHEEAAMHKIHLECYDVQGGYYCDLYRRAKPLLEAGLIFGDEAAFPTVRAFLEAPALDWVWVFLRRDAGMVPVTLSVDAEDELFRHGLEIAEDGIARYVEFMEKFGADQLWSDPPKMPLRLNKARIPSYNRGVLCEQPADR